MGIGDCRLSVHDFRLSEGSSAFMQGCWVARVGGLALFFFTLLTIYLTFRTYSGSGACTRVLRRRGSTVGTFVGSDDVIIVSRDRFCTRSSAASMDEGRCIRLTDKICVRVISGNSAGPTSAIGPGSLVLIHFRRRKLVTIKKIGSCVAGVGDPAIISRFECSIASSSVTKLFARNCVLVCRNSSMPTN